MIGKGNEASVSLTWPQNSYSTKTEFDSGSTPSIASSFFIDITAGVYSFVSGVVIGAVSLRRDIQKFYFRNMLHFRRIPK